MLAARAPLWPSLLGLHPPALTRRSPARSVSLIECGPVHTPFPEKVEGGLGGMLDRADVETRDLFNRYRRHCERVIREAGQDPEEVVEVRAEQDCGSGGGPRVLQPSPGQRASSRCCRSSSRRYAPRARPCATSPPSDSCHWCSCASLTPAAPATSPLRTSQRSTTRPPRAPTAPGRRQKPVNWRHLSSALLSPRNKGLIRCCLPRSPLRPRGVGCVWVTERGFDWADLSDHGRAQWVDDRERRC